MAVDVEDVGWPKAEEKAVTSLVMISHHMFHHHDTIIDSIIVLCYNL